MNEKLNNKDLSFSQEEKQMIRDSLVHRQRVLLELITSQNSASDTFKERYDICIALMKKIDDKWSMKGKDDAS